MDNIEIARAVASLPLTVLLSLTLIGGYLEWWVFGRLHRAQVLDLERRIVQIQATAEKWEGRYLAVRSCPFDACPLDDSGRRGKGHQP